MPKKWKEKLKAAGRKLESNVRHGLEDAGQAFHHPAPGAAPVSTTDQLRNAGRAFESGIRHGLKEGAQELHNRQPESGTTTPNQSEAVTATPTPVPPTEQKQEFEHKQEHDTATTATTEAEAKAQEEAAGVAEEKQLMEAIRNRLKAKAALHGPAEETTEALFSDDAVREEFCRLEYATVIGNPIAVRLKVLQENTQALRYKERLEEFNETDEISPPLTFAHRRNSNASDSGSDSGVSDVHEQSPASPNLTQKMDI